MPTPFSSSWCNLYAVRCRKARSLVAPALLAIFAHPLVAATVPEQPEIRTDIREAIVLGVSALSNSFDADHYDEPFFYANQNADGTSEFRHATSIGIPHVVGRCLLGGMMAEKSIGVSLPEKSFEILTRYCKSSFDNRDHLNSYYDAKRGNQRYVVFHNMREGLFSLVALMGGKDREWAMTEAHLMLLTLEKLTTPEGHFSKELADKLGMGAYCEGIGTDATTNGRLIDPLMVYYQLTKDPLALKLAGLYAHATLETAYTADGKFAPQKASGGHIHSLTSSLSGIACYAAFMQDRVMLAKCCQIIDHGIPEYFSSWGWGMEVMLSHPAKVQSRGEINQTGDVVRTALTLGQSVSPVYFELAERYIRGMLLPEQLHEENLREFVRENPHPKSDAERDILKRAVGGFGFPLPNARMRSGDWPIFTLDITSGAVHALSEAWLARVDSGAQAIKVNLLFDFDGSELHLHSALPRSGRIEFEARATKELWIRVPEWVDRTKIQLNVDGAPASGTTEAGYFKIKGLRVGAKGTLSFDVPEQSRTETVDGIQYQTKWLGNQIVEILPRGEVSPLPY